MINQNGQRSLRRSGEPSGLSPKRQPRRCLAGVQRLGYCSGYIARTTPWRRRSWLIYCARKGSTRRGSRPRGHTLREADAELRIHRAHMSAIKPIQSQPGMFTQMGHFRHARRVIAEQPAVNLVGGCAAGFAHCAVPDNIKFRHHGPQAFRNSKFQRVHCSHPSSRASALRFSPGANIMLCFVPCSTTVDATLKKRRAGAPSGPRMRSCNLILLRLP